MPCKQASLCIGALLGNLEGVGARKGSNPNTILFYYILGGSGVRGIERKISVKFTEMKIKL
jgi:hypothetical protein